MQIPLDFYRILGVPTRATPEQLQQAFEDRLQQLPRQEYSNAAIASRKQLLEEAFVVLADPDKRTAYDQQWVESETPGDEPKPMDPTLEIRDQQLTGALLLLQEVGAYAHILEIGASYLERPIDLARVPTSGGIVEEDVVLAMALAHLELGREQWQQSQFEAAGDSLQKGAALLEREQRFPDVQSEIRGDLYKLRPYRILELLNEAAPEGRQKGLALLQAMLDDRDGIDGNQDDQSGLSVNDFLRFIQQLRAHLTVAEQQEIFEREAARPSAVASYLAVYALIAHGVAEGTPDLVERAKTLLGQLGDRQDVAIETGMCWLLLGQPESAHQSVLRSQDEESLNFMRQYSEGAPDLIPGLYLYTENWLQQEVYPYFQDLAERTVSLQHYFDDPTIQQRLGELEAQSTLSIPWYDAAGPSSAAKVAQDLASPLDTPLWPLSAPSPVAQSGAVHAAATQSSTPSLFESDRRSGQGSPSGLTNSTGMDREPILAHTDSLGQSSRAATSTVPQRSQPRAQHSPKTKAEAAESLRQKVQHRNAKHPGMDGKSKKRRTGWGTAVIAALLGVGVVAGALALGRFLIPSENVSDRPPDVVPSSSTPAFSPSPSASVSPTTSPTVGATASPTASPSASPGATSPSPGMKSGPLSKSDAQQLVQSWQMAKALAMGDQHDGTQLNAVLAEPVLGEWENSVNEAKQQKVHWKYTLNQLEIQSVKPQGANQTAIKALVKETAQYYEQGKLVPAKSYTDSYPVQYIAVRQNEQWLIKDMQVLQ
ncbi:MAG: IMS domain-containing protein [Thermosynechococcaceae cyanobacterium]